MWVQIKTKCRQLYVVTVSAEGAVVCWAEIKLVASNDFVGFENTVVSH